MSGKARPSISSRSAAGYEALLRTCTLPYWQKLPLGRIEPMHVGEWSRP